MRQILAYSLILLALVSCGTGRKAAVSESKETATVQMRVGSYNLWRPVPADVRKGSVGTFNKRGENEDMNAAPRIDYIYYRGEGVKPLGYTCDNRRYEGYYPSDHCPIYADFIVTLPLVSTEGR